MTGVTDIGEFHDGLDILMFSAIGTSGNINPTTEWVVCYQHHQRTGNFTVWRSMCIFFPEKNAHNCPSSMVHCSEKWLVAKNIEPQEVLWWACCIYQKKYSPILLIYWYSRRTNHTCIFICRQNTYTHTYTDTHNHTIYIYIYILNYLKMIKLLKSIFALLRYYRSLLAMLGIH